MTISKSNIEAYILDYLEGNLDPLLSAELMAFLAENPAYEKWLSDYRDEIVPKGMPPFAEKHLLKKDFSDIPYINPGNFDEFCVAAAEGLLGSADKARLAEYVKHHPDKQQDAALYMQLKLKPDLSIVFSGKNRLKRTAVIPGGFRYVVYGMGMAAAVALLLTLALLLKPGPSAPVYSDDFSPKKSPAVKDLHEDPAPVPALPLETAESFGRGSDLRAVATENLPQASLNPPREETQQIARLRPRKAVLGHAGVPPPSVNHLAITNAPAAEAGTKKATTRTAGEGISIGTLAGKINFWKTAETVVTGFNYLTETQISLSRTLDEDGKVKGLALGLEDYSISGNKIK